MSQHDRVEKLVQALTTCLAELDLMEAHVAAAHLDSALQALHRHSAVSLKASNLE